MTMRRKHPQNDGSNGANMPDDWQGPVWTGTGFDDDNELPGMWSASDFMGGDPDERSYAERAASVEPDDGVYRCHINRHVCPGKVDCGACRDL